MITQARVKELFVYKDGDLVRAVPCQGARVGEVSGFMGEKGYRHIRADGRIYKHHRLVWLWHNGYLPENDLDHIDHDRTNNRIENLREASRSCNMRNSKQRKSSSGVKGVSWSKRERGWRAQIMIAGRTISLGYHEDLLEACCHRLAAEQAEGWDECDSESPALLFVKEKLPL
ncbi:MAG: HNH endonuclease [Desulfobulbaceae bacterium]|nr:HNH endonuclease [Desulfobulbaceae bacterium]